MKPKDQSLYDKAKKEADKTYSKPSAYKSGFIQKKYKELYLNKYGSTDAYLDDNKKKPLARWYREGWLDAGEKPGDYPLYRPTKRVSKETPKTVQEIPKDRLLELDKLKQKIKGTKNLPKF